MGCVLNMWTWNNISYWLVKIFYSRIFFWIEKIIGLILIVSYFLGTFGLRKPWYFPFTASYWKNVCGLLEKRQFALSSNLFFFNKNCDSKGLWRVALLDMCFSIGSVLFLFFISGRAFVTLCIVPEGPLSVRLGLRNMAMEPSCKKESTGDVYFAWAREPQNLNPPCCLHCSLCITCIYV